MAEERRDAVLDNSGDGPISVPGLNGVPLDWTTDKRFAGFGEGDRDEGECFGRRVTAREIAMLGVMNALTDKPDWHIKVMDDEIAAKWRQEALAMPLMSEKTWEWILRELRDKAALFAETGRVVVLDLASRVCKADNLVPSSLREELKTAVQPLLDAPEKDWHPGSNEQVLNLVHPSLFPLCYGRTEVLIDGGQVPLDNIFSANGKGAVHPAQEKPPEEEPRGYFRRNPVAPSRSYRFQWLPAEVAFVGEEGTDVKITSYINNLHSRHKTLYNITEKLISLSIGPWNDALVENDKARGPPRIVIYDADHEPDFPEFRNDKWDDNHWWKARHTDEYKSYREKVVKYLDLPADVQAAADQWVAERMDNDDAEDEHVNDDDEEEEVLDHRWETKHGLEQAIEIKHKQLRRVRHPEPGESISYDDWKAGKPPKAKGEGTHWEHQEPEHEYYNVTLQDTFRSKGLQVIVKLASIELTPEKPAYAGGSWHVEGMENEHIVATSLYYYDVENVTPSHLQFRAEAWLDDMNLGYEQDDHAPLAEVFGIESRNLRDEDAVQELGAVATPEGRLLAFPNTLQHRVTPFELADKSKPGHRRFVVLWLVDPNWRLCSTRNVPPQRHDWWAEQGYDKVKLGPLPAELVNMVRSEVAEWPMGMAEAKELRLELMKERTTRTEQTTYVQYNFCEH